MTGWFRDPILDDGEHILFRRAANLRRGRRSVGGEVTVTSHRLLFTPNQLEHLTGCRPVSVDLTAVGQVSVTRKRGAAVQIGALVGMMRPQLAVQTPTGPMVLTLPEPEELQRVLPADRP